MLFCFLLIGVFFDIIYLLPAIQCKYRPAHHYELNTDSKQTRRDYFIVNYEAELDDLLIQLLTKMYGINNEEIAYKIFLFRFLIECYEIYRKTNINNYELKSKMPDFLISELNLPLIEGNVYYKNERLLTYPDSKNSLANILDNWFFRYADTLPWTTNDVVLNLFLFEKK